MGLDNIMYICKIKLKIMIAESNPEDEYELCTVCDVTPVYYGGVCDECKEDNKIDWQE